MFIFDATMKKLVTYLMMLLSGMTVLPSCSMEMFDAEADIPGASRSIFISGVVCDAQTGQALEDIKIAFTAFLQDDTDADPALSDEVYTGNKGTFTIQTPETEAGSLVCKLTASDQKGLYESHTKQIIVTWRGTSYDREMNMYVVNDCNFKLTKAE